MYDVEGLGSIAVTRENGAGAPNSTLYWDDSKLSAPACAAATPTNPISATAGVTSSGGVHGWNMPASCTNGQGTWGDGRYIDNWAFATSSAQATIEVPLQQPGSITASATSLSTCSGGEVAINYTTTPTGETVRWNRMPGNQTGIGNVLDYPTATGTAPVSYSYTAYIPSLSGCESNTVTTVVTVNPRPVITPSVCSQTICSGQTGNITFISSVPGSTIHWERTPTTPAPASGTGDISQQLFNTGPSSLTYTYRVWAESPAPASCPSSTTITCEIVVTPGLTVTALANSATVCVGSPLSLLASVAQAGTYTYSWTGPNGYASTVANPTVSATAAITQSGTYTVVVTDAAGCSGTATVPVVVNNCCPTPIARATVSLCNNETLNLQTYVPTGGSFTLLTGAAGSLSGSTFNGIVSGAGLFKVGYRSAGLAANCAPDTITVLVRNCTPPLCNYPVNSIVVDASCGNSDGRAEVTLGGIPNNAITSFAWSNGQVGSAISGLAAGVYSLTATVTDGANVCSVVDSVQVNNIGGPVAELRLVTPATCTSGGVASLSIVSGTGPFAVSWTGATTGSQTAVNLGVVNITNLPAGSYVFRISSAATPGCYGYLSVTIPRNDDIRLTLTATATPATSCSTATGSIQIDVQPQVGVSAPFSYSLNGQLMGTSSLPSYTIANLPPGVYTVAASSSTGCTTNSQSVIINSPDAPAIAGWSAQSPNCPTDQGKLVFAGGQAGTTFRIREALTGAIIRNNISGATSTSLVVSAGTYIVQTTSTTCISADTLVVDRPQDIDFNVQYTPETCADGGLGSGDGSLSVVQITGGTAPYTIVVVNNQGQTIPLANLTSLPAGNYSVNVTDANGCTGGEGTLVTVPPCGIVCPNLDFNTVVVDALCSQSNGEATALLLNAPTGGGTALTYLWSNGFIGTTASGLNSGIYSVTAQISSSNPLYSGCKYETTVNVNDIGGPVFTVTPVTPASCTSANGSAVVNLQSGTGPFSISWAGQSSGSQTAPNLGSITINGLMAGNYTFTVTDATTSCRGVYDITLPGTSGNLNATASTSAVTGCGASDGQIFVNVTGGTGPFAYIINGFVRGVTSNRSFSVQGLPAGTYYVEVTDRNGCTTVRQNLLINTAGQPPITGFTVTSALCPAENGTISFNGTGAAIEQYVITIAGTATQIGQTAGNVAASYSVPGGTYLITRTTSTSCVSTTVVSVTQPSGLDFNIQYKNPTCDLPSSGSLAVVQANGGTAPYSVTVTGAAGVVSNLSILTSGSYTVTLGDANGCTFSKAVSLTGGSSFSVTASASSTTVCIGSGGLMLNATVSPAGSYTYAFSGPNGFAVTNTTGTASFSATSASQSGSYTVVVTDAAGCSGTATVPVTVTDCTIPCNLTVTASASQTALCVGGSTTLFSAVTPTGSYTYVWSGSNGFSSSLQNPVVTNIQPNPEGGPVVFTVRGTDANGCIAQASVVVDVQQPAVVITSNAPLCAGNTLSLSATGGFNSYSWSGPNGFTSNLQNPTIPNATTAATGSYSVVVTNALGCTASASHSLTIATQPSLTVTAGPSLTICSGQSTTLAVNGNNNSPVVWANSLGQSGTGTSINFAGIRNVGTQPLSVTYVIGATAGSCSDEEVVVVTILPEPVLVVQPSQVIYCDIEEVTLIATATPSTAIINWTRTPTTPGTASGSGVGTVTIQETLPAANYIYTFTATGANGCSTTPMIVPVTVQQ
ncbi:hypothetical protein GCM10027347_60070 [Larkinella harenae]